MRAAENPLGWPPLAWRVLLAVMFITAVWSFGGSLSNFARFAGALRDMGSPGMVLDQPQGTPWGWSRVAQIAPNSPATEAGLQRGDVVRVRSVPAYGPMFIAGQGNMVEVRRGDTRFRTTVLVPLQPFDSQSSLYLLLSGVSGIFTTVLGLLLLLRGHRNRAAAELGIVILAISWNSARAPPWGVLDVLPWLGFFRLVDAGLVSYFLVAFCLEISGGARSEKEGHLIRGSALGLALFHAIGTGVVLYPAPLPLFGDSMTFLTITIVINHLFGYSVIARNYLANDAPMRNRLKIIVLAFIAYTLSVLAGAYAQAAQPPVPAWFWLVPATATLMSFVAPGLLTYAVLRQKLFDLGFALNRTLVYGVVSFVLLAAFGLAKWVIEHLIPESWHEGSEYYSVAIALGLFLVLHRVHDWVENNVERYVFSPWHRNEEALRRFVTAAGHMEKTDVLCPAFAEEAGRFAKGAGAALYLRQAGGTYSRACGTFANALPECDGDDLALALMRAERASVKLGETKTALAGVLALPMLDHGKLAGFLLLDRKGDGTDYRPDEIEALGWAAHQIGLDLQAMHASELEAEVAGLNAKAAWLSEERDRLSAMLAAGPRPELSGNGEPAAPLPATSGTRSKATDLAGKATL